jgi:hypothetical protein
MLAAPGQDVRASFVLPTIKCSVCNLDVAISELADHDDVCGKTTGGDSWWTQRNQDAYDSGTAPSTSAPKNIPKASKQPLLPRIDARAASTNTVPPNTRADLANKNV